MISRRSFAAAALSSAAIAAWPRAAGAEALPHGGWRRFQVTTRVDLADVAGPAQAWLPLAGVEQVDWIRPEGSGWTLSPNATATRVQSGGVDLLHVQWADGRGFAEAVSTVTTRGRTSPLDGPTRADVALSPAERALYLRGTAEAPTTTGIVKDTADRITAGRTGDVDKARALYDWVVENTFRSAPVPGCGEGEVVRMLNSGVLGGKCADINPLFVALARASGLPARDLYGIRVAPSRLGYKSLGPSTPAVTKAQHCRAEVFLDGFGWTAMDPADVRKVMLEETPGGLALDAPKVQAARARLFGSWEGNWVPFNASNDVMLPGDGRARPVNFLMYPQVEAAGALRDCYAPDQVRYTITAAELAI